MARAFVFPGQGSQAVGMGRDLAAAFVTAREVFEEVDEALSQKLSQLIFDGPSDQLTLTENAQPALMAVSLAVVRVLEHESGQSLATRAKFVAGHSLGEYSALTAAGVLSLADTARLLQVRAQAMQAAVPVGVGAMAAILGLDYEAVCALARDAAGEDVCVAANDNAPGQVVVSGHRTAVERAIDLARTGGAKRALLLPVSAPFHCSLMIPAADVMAEALSAVPFAAPACPVVVNVKAVAETNPDALRQLLVAQVTGAVRWRESVDFMALQGVEHVVELGAGKVLSGLVRRINKDMIGETVGTVADIETFLKKL